MWLKVLPQKFLSKTIPGHWNSCWSYQPRKLCLFKTRFQTAPVYLNVCVKWLFK